MNVNDLKLCLVTDPVLCREHGLVATVLDAVAGGATSVQLRDKFASDRDLVEQARRLLDVLKPLGIPLIVNDRVEVARLVGAQGIHVGREDMPVREVRQFVGVEMWIGFSVETPDAASKVDPNWVDYAGVGPVFSTGTKPDALPPVGPMGLKQLVASLPVPAIAIGGIDAGNAGQLYDTGVQGIAVISAICGQKDPRRATQNLVDSLEEV